MISEHQQELASLYALGALSPSEHQAFEAVLNGDPELQALARDLQSAIAVAATATPAVSVPSSLKNKVLRRIDELEAAKTARPAPPVSRLGLNFAFAAGDSGWKQLPIPGASIKLLSLERDRGYAVLMGKLEPGTRYPAHLNAAPRIFTFSPAILSSETANLSPAIFITPTPARNMTRIIPSMAAHCLPC